MHQPTTFQQNVFSNNSNNNNKNKASIS